MRAKPMPSVATCKIAEDPLTSAGVEKVVRNRSLPSPMRALADEPIQGALLHSGSADTNDKVKSR